MSIENTSPPAMNARISIPTESPLPLAFSSGAPDNSAASPPAALPWLE
ncbi:MAG: hypothetical protein ACLQLH_17505 [Terracidiphilus sp.]